MWRKLVKPSLCPRTSLLVIDVQNDFISGTMALIKCPAKQEGSDVVPVINKLIDTIPFDVITYSLDWHPASHCSFIENVQKRKLSKYSPVSFSLCLDWSWILFLDLFLVFQIRKKKTSKHTTRLFSKTIRTWSRSYGPLTAFRTRMEPRCIPT